MFQMTLLHKRIYQSMIREKLSSMTELNQIERITNFDIQLYIQETYISDSKWDDTKYNFKKSGNSMHK